jgi:hypothetical protein
MEAVAEAVEDQAAAVAVVVVAAAVVVGDVEDKKIINMKKVIIHSAPVVVSFMWLMAACQTLNPIIIKGPDFLKFYLILVLGFYISVFILNSWREAISKTTLYCTGFIFLLGTVKLIRGIMLGKPVGFLIMILILECIVAVFLIMSHINKKIK